jgi:hypothetical protein
MSELFPFKIVTLNSKGYEESEFFKPTHLQPIFNHLSFAYKNTEFRRVILLQSSG